MSLVEWILYAAGVLFFFGTMGAMAAECFDTIFSNITDEEDDEWME